VDSFAPLAASSTALLTTFRASGEGVATPVSIALEGGRAYFVTAADTGKVKRLAREPRVTLAPCTVSGKVVGETVSGQARTLPVHGGRRNRRLLRPTRSLFWSHLLYRLRGKTMNVYEVVPVDDGAPPRGL
jgi:uncharacterized protein